MRHANANWNLPGTLAKWDQVNTALLMDLRDGLDAIQRNTAPLQCSNALKIPALLRKIEQHLRPAKLSHRQIVRRNRRRR